MIVVTYAATSSVGAQDRAIDAEDVEAPQGKDEAEPEEAPDLERLGRDEAQAEAAEAIEEAEDELEAGAEAGEPGVRLGFELDASLVSGGNEPGLGLHAYPFIFAVAPVRVGWSLEIAIAPEIFQGNEADSTDGLPFDDPEGALVAAIVAPEGARAGVLVGSNYDLGESKASFDNRRVVFVEARRLGQVAYGTADSALGEYCVEPPSGSSNFDNDDLLSFGLCEGLAEEGTLVWRSPSFGPGIALAASVTSSDDDALDAEVAARSTSAMLLYAGPVGDGALEASFGFEQVAEFAGEADNGASSATSLQAGFAASRGAWTWGAGAALQDFDAPSLDAWAVGVAAAYSVDARLSLTSGIYLDRFESEDERSGRRETERSAGLAVEWILVEDRLAVDAGIAHIDRTFSPRDDTRVGIGLSLSR